MRNYGHGIIEYCIREAKETGEQGGYCDGMFCPNYKCDALKEWEALPEYAVDWDALEMSLKASYPDLR